MVCLIGHAIESNGQRSKYCGNKNREDISKIEQQFPFRETESIHLVSFKMEEFPREIPKTNGEVDFNRVFEDILLPEKYEVELLDILVNYNNDFTKKHVSWFQASCYEPRNAIVFVDSKGKVLGFIEICFQCQQYKIEPEKMAIGEFCDEKFNTLKKVFKGSGIKYGLDVSDPAE